MVLKIHFPFSNNKHGAHNFFASNGMSEYRNLPSCKKKKKMQCVCVCCCGGLSALCSVLCEEVFHYDTVSKLRRMHLLPLNHRRLYL